MKIYTKIGSMISSEKTAVALGFFDGVHLGHVSVVKRAVEYSEKMNTKTGVFTFALPENIKLKGDEIISINEKHLRMQKLGVNVYLAPKFEEFCELTPEEFVNEVLIKTFNAKAVFCGEDFKFGKNKSGNVEILKQICSKKDIEVFALEMELFENERISSTRIRESLVKGDIKNASKMMGEFGYTIDFPVMGGKKIGRTLGFPTINQIFPSEMTRPLDGVYITKTIIDDKSYPSATGIGTRPTVNGENRTCETFIIGFDGDLYDKNVRVEFLEYLWQTKKYDSKEELANMIKTAADLSIKYVNGDK